MRRNQNFYFMTDYHDLFRKCLFEWRRFRATSRNPEESCYHLFNVVLALNHLYDWLLNDPDVDNDIKMECVRRFNPYAESDRPWLNDTYRSDPYVPALDGVAPVNEWQRLVRQVCNRAKHLKSRPIIGYRIVWLLLKMLSGGTIRLGGRRRIRFPQYYVKNERGESVNLQILCEELMAEWAELVKPWRLYSRTCVGRDGVLSELPPWLISEAKQIRIVGFGCWFDHKHVDDARLEKDHLKSDYYAPCDWQGLIRFLRKGRYNAAVIAARYGILGDTETVKAPSFLRRRLEEAEWILHHGVVVG